HDFGGRDGDSIVGEDLPGLILVDFHGAGSVQPALRRDKRLYMGLCGSYSNFRWWLSASKIGRRRRRLWEFCWGDFRAELPATASTSYPRPRWKHWRRRTFLSR